MQAYTARSSSLLLRWYSHRLLPIVDEASNYEVFKIELPDVNQDLSYQVLRKAAKTFTLLHRLPIEIRLRVWRECFPERTTILLEPTSLFFEQAGRESRYGIAPVILRVNRESRRETYKNYFHIRRHWDTVSCRMFHIFLNPFIDEIRVDTQHLISPGYRQ